MAWVTDNPNQITGRRYPLRFRFHAAMAGALGIGGDLTRWSPSELTEARDLAATYKAIRPVVQRGRPYRLPRSAATGSAAPWSADRLTAEMLGSRADAPVSQGNRA